MPFRRRAALNVLCRQEEDGGRTGNFLQEEVLNAEQQSVCVVSGWQ